ncbi:GNAT family N-acetyltransferase [Bifidobacterium saguini]|nr:GNAT family N-acetyltransferase [Bifidobacterium saguini]
MWASQAGSAAGWNACRRAAHTWVAAPIDDTCDGDSPDSAIDTPIGFIDVDDDGYIDMLFVDPAYGRMDVATLLLTRVEQFATDHGVERLTVHASITARPFFTRHGFRTVETRHPTIETVSFINYLMAREIPWSRHYEAITS